MRIRFRFLYLSVLVVIFLCISLSKDSVEIIRTYLNEYVIALSTYPKAYFIGLATKVESSAIELSAPDTDLTALHMENLSLQNQIAALLQILEQNIQNQEQLCSLLHLQQTTAFQYKRKTYQHALAQLQLYSTAANVIFCGNSSGNATVWIDVGTETNHKLRRPVVAANSPVVLGNHLIGIIDYAGKTQSRVRLITDPSLQIAVQIARGGYVHQNLLEQTTTLMQILNYTTHLLDNAHAKFNTDLIAHLQQFKQVLTKQKLSFLLAKGMVMGSQKILWRYRRPLLQGNYFHYTEVDEQTMHSNHLTPMSSLIDQTNNFARKGDLLITNGLDGIFPLGLSVGYVTEVAELKEGSCTFELQASPAIISFANLKIVFVLPPANFLATEQNKLAENLPNFLDEEQ